MVRQVDLIDFSGPVRTMIIRLLVMVLISAKPL